MSTTVNRSNLNNSEIAVCSSNWIKPNDLMKTRKLKARRSALRARLNDSQSIYNPENSKLNNSENEDESQNLKRRNPFKCLQAKQLKFNDKTDKSENSNDSSLFHLFDIQPKKENEQSDSKSYNTFLNILSHSSKDNDTTNQGSYQQIGSNVLHIDWSLKSRVRFFSSKPFHWKSTFKTSEEASGTTGFVRCLNSKPNPLGDQTLDTSTNAQFYQCCLYWQHPSLPHISLFPRGKQKVAQTGMYASEAVSNALHTDWSESLRSLYQLLRVRQCPFFYLCAQGFTCLFRAAGAAGFPHTHALISPTTRGFREAMKREGVEFSMPLHDKASKAEDIIENSPTKTERKEEEISTEIDNVEDREPEEFLEDLGLEASQFPSLNQSKTKINNQKLAGLDGSPESLIYVEDIQLQGLINFLLNCGSCISIVGPLAGVPPTLLSPIGFHGGTLRSLKISSSSVRTPSGEKLYSIDLQGPVLPTTVLHLSKLLSCSVGSFNASLTPLVSTIAFSATSPSNLASPMPMAFAHESLVDCGLGKDVRTILCQSTEILREKNIPFTYREIKYANCRYFCSDM